jgi:beta-N-acetylhexosaminidase
MKAVGMATTGKHFPGHGAVLADSHVEIPVDTRTNLMEQDMAIFKAQVKANLLDAIMPAHVIYPHYDDQPASGSSYWLKQILRQQIGFQGIIFSDDLSMEGASVMGNVVERAHQSLVAGCDMILVCNEPTKAIDVIDNLPILEVLAADKMLKKAQFSLADLKLSSQWKRASEALKPLTEQ